jgi:hypothetical protein
VAGRDRNLFAGNRNQSGIICISVISPNAWFDASQLLSSYSFNSVFRLCSSGCGSQVSASKIGEAPS